MLSASLSVLCCLWPWYQSMENNATCRDHPTMVSKPYYRVDLFNRQMTNVLLTSLLVTTIENKTVAHIGTSTGRLLQVQKHDFKNE